MIRVGKEDSVSHHSIYALFIDILLTIALIEMIHEDDSGHARILSEAVEALLVDKSFFNQELHRFNKLIQVINRWMVDS